MEHLRPYMEDFFLTSGYIEQLTGLALHDYYIGGSSGAASPREDAFTHCPLVAGGVRLHELTGDSIR